MRYIKSTVMEGYWIWISKLSLEGDSILKKWGSIFIKFSLYKNRLIKIELFTNPHKKK